MRLVFFVQGSAIVPYEVVFIRTEGEVKAHCTCPAGEKQVLCKHVLGLLEGDVTQLLAEKSDNPDELLRFLSESSALDAYNELQMRLTELSNLQKIVSNTKQKLKRILLGK